MSDEPGLLRAIADEPAEDLPRLIWADWLDDAGRPQRAELVRVQVGLARTPCDHRLWAEDCPSCGLKRRERDLLAAHGAAWVAEELPGWGVWPSVNWIEDPGARMTVGRRAAFRRGLLSVLFLKTEEYLRDGREYGRRLTHLVRVQLTDRWPLRGEPFQGHRMGCRWAEAEEYAGQHHLLPAALAQRLPTSPAMRAPATRTYPEETASLAALSRACVLYACGAPPLSDFPALLTVAEAAGIARESAETVRGWLHSRRLLGYRAGRDWRVPRERLVAFLRESGLSWVHALPDWGGGDLEGDA